MFMLCEQKLKNSNLPEHQAGTARENFRPFKGESKMNHKAEPKILSPQTFRRALASMLIGIGSCALIANLGGALTTQAASSALTTKDEVTSLRTVNVTAPVSLTRGQTFRLNFFNAGSRPLEIDPCFLDANGRHLRM